MSASFPTSPSFNEQFFSAPPAFESERAEYEGTDYLVEYQTTVNNYLQGQYLGLRNLQNTVASGWLISTLRVLDLDADTITADSIFTQDLYVGASGNGSIGLLGSTTQIKVTDENGQDRVIMGELGAGNTNWGIQAIDENGDVVFQTGSTTFIDGVIINNASINDAQINTLNGSKLTGSNFIAEGDIQSNAVTAAKINVTSLSAISANVGTLTAGTINATVSINAGAISTGDLEVNGTVGIIVSGSGDITFETGGDMIMKANGTNFNFITFQTSGSATRGLITLNTASSEFIISSEGGYDLDLVGAGGIRLIAEGNNDVRMGSLGSGDIVAENSIIPDADNTHTLGRTAGGNLRWADVKSVLINGADFCYENKWRHTEPNHVYKEADPTDGIITLDENWEVVMWIHKNGLLETRGTIRQNVLFDKPDIARRESPDDRRKDNGAKKKGRR